MSAEAAVHARNGCCALCVRNFQVLMQLSEEAYNDFLPIRSTDRLKCQFQGGPWERAEDDTFSVFKARADQWAIIASMESSAYYKCLENENFMNNFDIRMTYQRAAEVPLIYWHGR